MSSLAADLTPKDIPLSKIYLDPNNPRFVGSDWSFIPDDEIMNLPVQQAARRRLIDHHDVDKLRLVMQSNGFLPIDRVVVRQFDDDNYVVLEGNRRICAAKDITGHHDDGEQISEDIMGTFQNISCLVYEGRNSGQNAAWIFQGLRHVSGISDWPAYNKAKLLVDRMEEDGLSLTEVGKSFGLSAHGAGQWVRGYFAFMQAKDETDVGRYIDEKVYPFFQEVFGRSSIQLKDWMRWDDAEKKFKDGAALNEFAGWLFPVEDEGGDAAVDPKDPTKAQVEAAWSNRRIIKRDNLREISYMIHDAPKQWMAFRSGTDLDKAYNTAVYNQIEESRSGERSAEEIFYKSLEGALRELNETPFSILSDSDKRRRLLELTGALTEVIEKVEAFNRPE